MTVLGNPQDPVYVPIVPQGSGNQHLYIHSISLHVKMADGFVCSSRSKFLVIFEKNKSELILILQ